VTFVGDFWDGHAQTIHHDLVDRRSSRLVRTFVEATDDWQEGHLDGPHEFEFSADGRQLPVRHHNGRVERIPLPR
jgi:hypothetical protein